MVDAFLRTTRAVNRALHYVAGALVALLMFVTVYDVVGRWLFNRPFRGTVELTQLAMLAVVYLGFAYAQHEGDHISVDLLYQRVGSRTRAVFDGIAAVLSIVILTLLAWQVYVFSFGLQAGGHRTAVRRIPLHPMAYIVMIGAVAFVLALIATSVESVRAARREADGGPEAPGVSGAPPDESGPPADPTDGTA